jgi:hypothetical protein
MNLSILILRKFLVPIRDTDKLYAKRRKSH